VEELEEHLMTAGESRAAARAQRSAADEAAEMDPASAAISAALNVLSRGGEAAGEDWTLPLPFDKRYNGVCNGGVFLL